MARYIETAAPTEDDEHVWTSAHLIDAERGLIWTRRAAFAGWAVILYAQGYTLEIGPVWLTYAGGLAYMGLLHWCVRRGRVSPLTSWTATISDSIITFLMCAVTGGGASPFLPFFYFTTLAGAFRFGVSRMILVLLLNGAAILALHIFWGPSGVGSVLLILFYLGFAAALGAMLADWARTNLNIALSRTAALRVERDRSQALLHKLIDTQEEERKRLAGDLHDRMGARLFHLQHNLAQCAQPNTRGPALDAHYEVMRRDLIECNSDVRSLMNELRPNVLDDFGFVEALSEYITGLVAKIPFKVEVRLDPGLQQWRSQQDAMLFRLLQEALLNVRKHAAARRVNISMARIGDRVELEISDDGNGFDPASVPVGHFGVMMMRERAQAAGATFAIVSSPGDGTRIALVFPEGA